MKQVSSNYNQTSFFDFSDKQNALQVILQQIEITTSDYISHHSIYT